VVQVTDLKTLEDDYDVYTKYGTFSAYLVDAKTDKFYEEKSKLLKLEQRDGRLC
jgi:hypothetical protein